MLKAHCHWEQKCAFCETFVIPDRCKNPGVDYTGVRKPSNNPLAYPKVLWPRAYCSLKELTTALKKGRFLCELFASRWIKAVWDSSLGTKSKK